MPPLATFLYLLTRSHPHLYLSAETDRTSGFGPPPLRGGSFSSFFIQSAVKLLGSHDTPHTLDNLSFLYLGGSGEPGYYQCCLEVGMVLVVVAIKDLI